MGWLIAGIAVLVVFVVYLLLILPSRADKDAFICDFIICPCHGSAGKIPVTDADPVAVTHLAQHLQKFRG